MKILAITTPVSGVGYHRILLPLTSLKKEKALATDILNDDVLANGFDILLINRHIPEVELETLLAYRAKYGFKLIVDIDDYWHLDPWHILYGNYPTDKIIAHIKAADMVTCTHAFLMGEIYRYNKMVAVIPNALPYDEDQFTDQRTPTDRTVFAWMGGATHEKDLDIIRGPMKRILSDPDFRKSARFVMSGFDKHSEPWHRMAQVFIQAKDPKLAIVRPGLDPYHYMNLLNDADVAMAPLVDSHFNRMKSNLKVLEAGAKRIPIIVSDVHPYNRCPYALKVESQGDWYRHMKAMLRDKKYREDMGNLNGEWCRQYHHLTRVNKLRREIYESII